MAFFHLFISSVKHLCFLTLSLYSELCLLAFFFYQKFAFFLELFLTFVALKVRCKQVVQTKFTLRLRYG